MWPDSKGKGGKEGSPKSKDGGGDSKPNAGASGSSSGGKSGGKGRNTKTKMKALSAEGLPVDAAQAAAKLEQDIIKAAQNISQAQARAEETKTLIEVNRVPESAVRPVPGEIGTGTSANLMRLPDTSNENMGDKISGLWKNRVLGAYRANPRASQHILPAMPNNRGALEITEKARADAQQTAMINVVDKMFDSFQNLAFEFNNVASPELELTWIRPIISRENISSWHQAAQIVSVFTGRISTRYWTMVIRGTLDSVLAYVIPADKLLSFSNQPANFQPVIELIPVADGLAVRWSAMGRQASPEDLSNIYRALLDNMIRIAQNDAPCDSLIDLSAYGVSLDGPVMDMGAGFAQAQTQVMGQPIDYSNKYQQQFYREDATSPSLPALPNLPNAGMPNPFAKPLPPSLPPQGAPPPSPSAPPSMEASSSADWKPVVRSVRGANPPGMPLTPGDKESNVASGPNQNEWRSGNQSAPTAPGFNQDEPWKYGGPVGGQTNSSTSINSLSSQSGVSRSQSFGGAGYGSQQAGGSPIDEPPLPSLPAHLFEGLPPRPQTAPSFQNPSSGSSSGATLPGTSFGSSASYPALPAAASPFSGGPNSSRGFEQSQSGSLPQSMPPAPPNQPNLPSPQWPASSAVPSYGSAGLSSSASHPALSTGPSDDDGWKSAGIPITKGMQSLPPLPVQGYQSPAAPPFVPEATSLSGSLVSPESFTSGSIRVDAIAREIAQSSVSLPAAIPGFEPYKIDESAPAPRLQNDFFAASGMPPAANVSTATSSSNEAVGASVDTWPEELDEKPGQLWPKPREKAKEAEPEPARPDADVEAEQNAFINFDSEVDAGPQVQNPDPDDPEIVALFEGEPVNAPLSESALHAGAGFAEVEASLSQDKDEDAWGPVDGLSQSSGEAASEKAPEITAFQNAFLEGMNFVEGGAKSEVLETSAPSREPAEADSQISNFSESSSSDLYSEVSNTAAPPQTTDSSNASQFSEPAKSSEYVDRLDNFDNDEYAQSVEPVKMPEPAEHTRSSSGAHSRAAIEAGFRMAQEAISAGAAGSITPDAPSTSSSSSSSSSSSTSFPFAAPPVVPDNVNFESQSFAGVASSSSANSSIVVDSVRSLKAEIDRLIASLDSELEIVSAKGSEAFARRDLKGAERLIKLAETLSEFKDSLGKLKEEHGSDLS